MDSRPQSEQGADAEARRKRPSGRRILVGLLAAFVVVAVALGAVAWRATTASVSLGFISGRVEAALRERLPAGSQVAVGSTAFSYRRGEGVYLRVRDLQLLLPGIASVAAGELATSTTLSAILAGRVDLKSVVVSGLDVGVATPPRLPRKEGMAELLRQASKMLVDQAALADGLVRGAGLDEVVVRNAAVHLLDAGGRSDSAPLDITEASWVPLGEGRSKVWMQVVEPDKASWDVTLERRKLASGESTLTIEVEDVPLASIAPVLSGERGGPYFRSSLTLQMRMAEAADGSFLGLRGVLSSGEGAFSLTGTEEVNVEEAVVHLLLDKTGDRLSIPNGEVRTQAGRVRFEGIADLGEPGHLTLVTRIRDGVLPTPIGDAGHVPIIGGGGVARFNFAEVGVEIEQLSVTTPEGTASLVGQASVQGETPGLSFALSVTEMPAAVVRALWPPFVATKTRGWFDLNVKGGLLGPATLQVALPLDRIGPENRGKVLPDYALVGSLPFRDGTFTPIRTFPPIRNATGGITFGSATASIWAQTGVIEVAGRGELQAGGTTLIIPELGRSQPRGDLHLELSGPAPALAEASNTPPLSIAAKRGIRAPDISGDAALSLDANIPIYESDFADVTPNFRLALTGFSSKEPIDGRDIKDADLVLEGNPKSYTVKGSGTVDGLKAEVDLILGTAAPESTAFSVSLDDEARERLGFRFGNLLKGPVLAAINSVDPTHQQVALDLKQARISLPFLGWEKGAGVPATASFIMEKTATQRNVTNFVLSGKGFEASGSLSFGEDGRLRSLEFDKLALRPGDRLGLTATASGQGYKVKVHGAALDARGIIQGARSGGAAGGADIFPITIALDLEVVAGQNDVSLSGVAGTLTVGRKGLEAASIKGRTTGNQPFEWTLGREGDTRVLRLIADGGGSLVRFLGIYSRIAGGSLVLDYSGPVGGAGTGVAVMRDFRLINETALDPAISAATHRDGLTPATAKNELQFTQLRVPFRQEGWVITIVDAALRGTSLGATASGTINLPGSKIALSGTFIPAFGINNVPGAIPLLGGLFGGRNEGLFGITYRLFGPLDQPQLSMNPISALAPGIFRKIFEYR